MVVSPRVVEVQPGYQTQCRGRCVVVVGLSSFCCAESIDAVQASLDLELTKAVADFGQ
jgi:hypothetical protein